MAATKLDRIAAKIKDLYARGQRGEQQIGELLRQAHQAQDWTTAAWDQWCETEAGIGKAYAYRLIAFVRVRDALVGRIDDDEQLPQREGQARALAKLIERPALLDQAWQLACDNAEGSPTGADVEAATAHVIAEVDGQPRADIPPTSNRLKKAARRAVKAASAFRSLAIAALASDDHDLMLDAVAYGQRVAINLVDQSAALLLIKDHNVDLDGIEIWRQAVLGLLPGEHLPEPTNPGTIDNDLDRPQLFQSSGELAAEAGRPRKLPADDEPWGED